MLSRRGRKRRAPARYEEATPYTRSRRSATITARSDGHNGDDDSPPAITSDASATVGPAANDTSVGSAAVDANGMVLQQQMQHMQQQMQSMHDIVSTLASVSSDPAAATALPSSLNTPVGATALPSSLNPLLERPRFRRH